MRPLDFFFEMRQMIVEMGFTWSLIIPDHLELISDVLKECVKDRRTNGPTDGHRDAGTHLKTYQIPKRLLHFLEWLVTSLFKTFC